MASRMEEAKGVVKHVLLAKFKDSTHPDQIEQLIKSYANLVDLVPPMKAFHWYFSLFSINYRSSIISSFLRFFFLWVLPNGYCWGFSFWRNSVVLIGIEELVWHFPPINFIIKCLGEVVEGLGMIILLVYLFYVW